MDPLPPQLPPPQKRKLPPAVSIVAALIGAFFGMTAFRHCSNQAPDIDQAIVATSSQLNKTLPMMVDKETRLDNTVAGLDKTIIYRYTLVNMNAADVPKDKLVAAVRPGVVATYKTNDSMKEFRNNGVTMKYQYSDKGGVFITEFSVGPKDL